MHRRSSGSPAEEDADEPVLAVSRSPTEPSSGPNVLDLAEKSRPQAARTGTSFDLRRDASTPRSRNSSLWRTSSASHDSRSSSVMMPLASQRLPMEASPDAHLRFRPSRLRSPWPVSILTALTTLVASIFIFFIVRSFSERQIGGDGCGIPVMSPTFIRMVGFDTEHTRFASKYNLFLYREEGVDWYHQENLGVSILAHGCFVSDFFAHFR